MTKRVFIWVAHPRSHSLCGGIADSYQAGALATGAEVRRIDLAEMSFDTSFDGYGEDALPLEPDLLAWQDGISWADHILIVHPYWWGAMPTRAKAVLDRALTPGFGFRYHKVNVAWDKLLKGKTADANITSGKQPVLDSMLYRRPARRVIRNQVLGFCGIRAKRVIQFGSVKLASQKKIAGWLRRAERMGAHAAA